MITRLIKTEEDYEKALSRIERLMDATPGSDDLDELELLTTLVKIYEDDQYPIELPDPVEAIKFRMEQLGLAPKDMVPYFGAKSKVSEVLNGKRPLTLAMMRSLHQNLRLPAEVLLKVPGANLPEDMNGLEWNRFPVMEMAKRRWLPEWKHVRGKVEERLREFIAQAGGMDSLADACFRTTKSARHNSKMDPYALMAWCLRVLALARQNPLPAVYVKSSIRQSTLQEIARLSYFENGPLLAKEYLEKQGIHLVVVPHLPKTYLDGAAMLGPDGNPIVGLTLRYDRIDSFWFCLLHELAHIAKHLSLSKRFIIDDLDLRDQDNASEDQIEKEADAMAQEGLIPHKVWVKHPMNGNVTAEMIHSIADSLKIHPAIVAGRVRHEKKNFRLFSRYIGSKLVRKHFIEP
ncbi:MAG: transcriptional regulator [Thermodesulfobacteriota bacterium]